MIAARAIALELHYELAESVAIESVLAQIKQQLAEGLQVVYASDMYLPRHQVEAMLARVGAPPLPLFLSSELCVTKRSGNLFRQIAAHFQVSLRDIHHTGDHRDSDQKVPRRLGVKTTWFRGALPTPLETELYRQLAGSSPMLAATLAGAMRAARLNLKFSVPPSASLARLGTQEAALIHIGFALWLLRQLGDLKPTKLSFLARDGYLASRIFQVFNSRFMTLLAPGAYVYASRQALHLAGLKSAITEEDRAWIMSSSKSMTFKDWRFRLGVSRSELSALPGLPTAIPRDDDALSSSKEPCLQLLETPAFLALVLQKARAARELASEYLAPNIWADDGEVAVVDIGWNGRMQRSLVETLSLDEAQSLAMHGFYLGILRTPAGHFGSYTAWLFDLRSGARPYCASHFQLFETLFSAPHATTYGYERNGAGEVVPSLARHDAGSDAWPELVAFQTIILDICESVRCDRGELLNAEQSIRSLSRKAVSRIFRAPEREHALAFAGVSFSSDQTDLGREQLVYDLTWKQQYRCLFDRNFKISPNHWREGQLALADAPFVRIAYTIRSIVRLWTKNQLTIRDILRDMRYRLRVH
jgi:hypothetical protein